MGTSRLGLTECTCIKQSGSAFWCAGKPGASTLELELELELVWASWRPP